MPLAMLCATPGDKPAASSSDREARKIALRGLEDLHQLPGFARAQPGHHAQRQPVQFVVLGQGKLRSGHVMVVC